MNALTPTANTPASSGSAVILVVDDDEQNVRLIARLLTLDGHEVHVARDSASALLALERRRPDVILLDVLLPGIDGFELCRRIKDDPATRLTPVVMITGLQAREHRIAGINAGADEFLSKPFDAEELRARVRALLRLKRYTDDLESAESVIFSLALTVEARDAYTDGHCQRLAGYAAALGEALSLSPDDLAALRRGAYLHDVGKIGIPDAVLQKPSRLTDVEFDLMKRHTIIGERLCGTLRSLAPVRPIVRHHHELLDGSGYPDGLRGDAIPLLAQIVAIADAYDAMTTTRPYRKGAAPEHAFAELARDVANGARRKDLVDTFIRLGTSGQLERHIAAGPGDWLTQERMRFDGSNSDRR